MMPMTPIGTRTRDDLAGHSDVSSFADVAPTGSGRAAMSSRPCAIASMRSGVSVRRSMKEDFNSFVCAAARSAAFSRCDELRVGADVRRPWRASAAFFCAVGASARHARGLARGFAASPAASRGRGRASIAVHAGRRPSSPDRRDGPSRRAPGSPSAFSISLDLAARRCAAASSSS